MDKEETIQKDNKTGDEKMKNDHIRFPTIEELQNSFKKTIIDCLKYLKQFSMYDILSYYYWDYKISFGNVNDGDSRWFKNIKIVYLQILVSCIFETGEERELEEENINEIDDYLNEIYGILMQYGMVFDGDSQLTEEEKDYLNHSYSFKDWSGKRYDIFEIQHHKDLLGCLEKEFENTYKFTLEELYSGILNLKNCFYFKFEKSINNIRTNVNKKNIIVDNDGIHPNIKMSRKEKTKLDEDFMNIYSLELANLKKCKKWTIDFIEKYVIEKECYKNFADDINIDNWNEIVNKIKYRPIIRINNEYYLLLQQKFYDNFDKIAIQGICEKLTNKEQQSVREKYTSNIERVVAKYFNEIFNSNDCYINNFYYYEKKIIENDILIIVDNNFFIIEVKSGSFSPELAINDLESHKKSLQELIKKANEQQDRLERCLTENKNVPIYDSNNKRSRKQKTIVEIKDESKIFKIIVTAEAFNDIEARADKVKLITISDNTLVLCLDDLRVYSDYFKGHPGYFIQYLLQRKKTIGNKNVDLYDELYHLGMWLEYNHYNEVVNQQVRNLIEEEKINQDIGLVSICGEDWMKELDEYYNSLWFKKRQLKKPFKILDTEIKEIVDFCEKNHDIQNRTYLTTFLLDLDCETQRKIGEIIEKSRVFYKTNKRPKYRIYGIKRKR